MAAYYKTFKQSYQASPPVVIQEAENNQMKMENTGLMTPKKKSIGETTEGLGSLETKKENMTRIQRNYIYEEQMTRDPFGKPNTTLSTTYPVYQRVISPTKDRGDKFTDANAQLQNVTSSLKSPQQEHKSMQQGQEVTRKKLIKKNPESETDNLWKTLGETTEGLSSLETKKENMTRIQRNYIYQEQMTLFENPNTTLSMPYSVYQGEISPTKDRGDKFTDANAQLTSSLKSPQQEHKSMQQGKEVTRKKLIKKNPESETDNLWKTFGTQETELSSLKTKMENLERDLKTLTDDNDQLRKNLSALKGEKARIQADHERQMTDIRNDNSTLTSTNSLLREQISSKDDEISSCKRDRDRLKANVRTLKEESETSQKKINDLENQHKNHELENRGLQSMIDAQGAEIVSLKTGKENIKRDMKTLTEDNAQLRKNVSVLEGEKTKMQTDHEQQMTDIRNNNSALTSTNSLLQAQISSKDDELVLLKRDKDTLKERMRTLKRERETSQKEMSDLENQHKKLESEIRDLQSQIGSREEEIKQMEMEIIELKRPKKKNIALGMRFGSSIGMTMADKVTKDLIQRLEQTIDKTKFDLTINRYQKASETQKGPMVVLCLNEQSAQSVRTNIQDALAGIEVGSDVMVVVIRHSDKDNFLPQTPTSRRVKVEEFGKLGAILDMMFSNENGLYDCDVNTTNIEKLATNLKNC